MSTNTGARSERAGQSALLLAAFVAVFLVGVVAGTALGDMRLPSSPIGEPPIITTTRIQATPIPPATPRPTPVRYGAHPSVSRQPASGTVWDRLAQCESGGNWGTNTGNGYYGGIQFSASTWRAAGGTKYAPYAHQATREQQIAIAESWLAKTSWSQWPACSRRLGLR